MKRLMTSLLVVAALIAGSLWWESHVRSHIGELSGYVDQALIAVQQGDAQQAEQAIGQFSGTWSHVRDHWTLLIDHQTLTRIERNEARAEVFLQQRDWTLAQAELIELSMELQNTIESYELSLANLF